MLIVSDQYKLFGFSVKYDGHIFSNAMRKEKNLAQLVCI